MSNADVRIDEDGNTWIRVDTAYGSYEYNKTKMDADMAEMMNQPIKMPAERPRDLFYPPTYVGFSRPSNLSGWVAGSV